MPYGQYSDDPLEILSSEMMKCKYKRNRPECILGNLMKK